MIRKISLAALCLTAAMAVAHETAPPPGPDMQRMALLLDLDEGQKVAVENVLIEQHEAMVALRKQAKESGERPSREQMKTQFEQARRQTVEKLRPVLSDLQLKKFEALAERPLDPPGARGKRPDNDK